MLRSLFTGRSTYVEANFYWRTATLAYAILIPVALPAGLGIMSAHSLTSTGGSIIESLGAAVVALPLTGSLYSFAVRNATAANREKFMAAKRYRLHDLAIAGI